MFARLAAAGRGGCQKLGGNCCLYVSAALALLRRRPSLVLGRRRHAFVSAVSYVWLTNDAAAAATAGTITTTLASGHPSDVTT
jgi:hypothetical protein